MSSAEHQARSAGLKNLAFWLAVLLAWFAEWILTAPIPEGRLFATLIPVANGRLPPTMFGGWKYSPVPPVPDDLKPSPRPGGEMFLSLPGGKMPANGLGLCCRASAYDDESVTRSVMWYLLKGGRHLDTAQASWNAQSAFHYAAPQCTDRTLSVSCHISVITVLPPTFNALRRPRRSTSTTAPSARASRRQSSAACDAATSL